FGQGGIDGLLHFGAGGGEVVGLEVGGPAVLAGHLVEADGQGLGLGLERDVAQDGGAQGGLVRGGLHAAGVELEELVGHSVQRHTVFDRDLLAGLGVGGGLLGVLFGLVGVELALTLAHGLVPLQDGVGIDGASLGERDFLLTAGLGKVAQAGHPVGVR